MRELEDGVQRSSSWVDHLVDEDGEMGIDNNDVWDFDGNNDE